MRSRSGDPGPALIDIRHNIYLARKFTGGLEYADFLSSEMAFYAVTRCLEIISEASRRLPADVKARHPEIPWTAMAGAGNVYRHEYEDVQQALVWGVVQNRLPTLLAAVESELEQLG